MPVLLCPFTSLPTISVSDVSNPDSTTYACVPCVLSYLYHLYTYFIITTYICISLDLSRLHHLCLCALCPIPSNTIYFVSHVSHLYHICLSLACPVPSLPPMPVCRVSCSVSTTYACVPCVLFRLYHLCLCLVCPVP